MLAALNKDERVRSSLPPYMATMLEKMFHEYIVRPAELKEFEDNLEQHQKATGERGDTLLQKAVRDHNVGACGKVGQPSSYCVTDILTCQVYDNIGFDALGALLGLDAEAAEATACKCVTLCYVRKKDHRS